MSTWISIAVSMLAIYLASNEGRWQIARRKGAKLYYSVGLFVRLIYVVGVLAYPAVAALPTNDTFTTVGLLMIPVALVLTWPKTIVLSEQDVTELSWGGFRRRTVEWSALAHGIRVETRQESEVQLIPVEGKPITHTKYHVDRRGFVREVGKHIEVF